MLLRLTFPPEVPVPMVMIPEKLAPPAETPSKGMSMGPEKVLLARKDSRLILLF